MYRCIVMDPPWTERGGGKIKRGADRHYPTLPVREILPVVLASPLWRPDPAGCVLWCWATNNYLPDALWLIDALGFRYVTNAVWVKRGRPGLGQWLRGQHELLLLAVKGESPASTVRTERKDLSTLLVADRGEHSEKPEASYRLIEKRCEGPYAELFARRPRSGWDVWGNEVGGGEGEGEGEVGDGEVGAE
jgi:N6-adenosine-specific RNA methylase IME4